MTTDIKKLNKLVISFLKENADAENVEELWMNSANQKQVKTLYLNKSLSDKRKKDPNAPKRAKSAYLFFCNEQREKVKSDLGEESKATDVTRELGVRWNALKNSDKAVDKKTLVKYEKAATEDKARYDSEKKSYEPPKDDEDGNPKRRGHKKKLNKLGPKRAKSAYLYFCEEYRLKIKSDNPNMKATEITSQLGRMWNELKDDENRVDELNMFEKQATADKNRYNNEKLENGNTVVSAKPTKSNPKKTDKVESDNSNLDEELVEDSPSDKSKGVDSKAVVVKKNSSKKQSGFNLFCTEKRAGMKAVHPKAKPAEITKKLSAAWKALSKDEQEEWKSGVVVADN